MPGIDDEPGDRSSASKVFIEMKVEMAVHFDRIHINPTTGITANRATGQDHQAVPGASPKFAWDQNCNSQSSNSEATLPRKSQENNHGDEAVPPPLPAPYS